MRQYLRRLTLVFLVLWASLAAAEGLPIPKAGESGRATPVVISAQNSDGFLKPGDLLVLLYGGQSNILTKLADMAIVGAQKLAKKNVGLVSKAWRKADPDAVHGAIYLGNGLVAEADHT